MCWPFFVFESRALLNWLTFIMHYFFQCRQSGLMYARAMETYWLLLVAGMMVYWYSTNAHQRLSNILIASTIVILFYLPAKSFATTIYYFIVSINCVRWSPSGDMIASASLDATTVLLDFKTGKKLYTANTSDGSKFSLIR